MDDIWSIEAWDRVRHYFPNNTHGSRIVITTRPSNLASKFNPSNSLEMKFLGEASSWSLCCKIVFGEEICPPELEEIGKKIAEGCRGLPLSIVVAGGLLSKSEPTRENWELIQENLSSVVNSEDDGSCLQILYTSYNNLPVHLKPCFLYMGVFAEDEKIMVGLLIPTWVAEGFIKPIDGKSLEDVAEEHLEELIDRNLILVEGRNDCGDVETFKVHDLVRDLTMREAAKDRFLYSLMQRSSDDTEGIISTHRRIASSSDEEYPLNKLLGSVEATAELSLVRTLIGKFPEETLSLPYFRLLRACMVWGEERSYEYYEEIFIRLLNLRFFLARVDNHLLPIIPSYLWNLQTICILGNYGQFGDDVNYWALVIWKIPQLRIFLSVKAFRLPRPPLGGDEVVLENLHTLSKVGNLKFSKKVLKRIPNVRILNLYYYNDALEEEEEEEEEKEVEKCAFCLNNLHRLNKLQDLHLTSYGWNYPPMEELTLPYSLKQLTLVNTKFLWEEMASKVGCLPLLQVLKLQYDSVIGSQWETVEGQFSALKFLNIEKCDDLERWITDDNTHFPRLEHLVLYWLTKLREIPSSIGDIPTLRSITLQYCCDSANKSAQRIQEEQEELENQDIQLQVDGKKNL